eukprot:Opistho-1_new@21206
MTCSLPGCWLWAAAGEDSVASAAVRAAAARAVVSRGWAWVLPVMVFSLEEEGEAGGDRAVLGTAGVGNEGGVDRVVDAQHEALGHVVARADAGIAELRVGDRCSHQTLVREIPELAQANAEERRQTLVRPGLGEHVDVPEVGAGIQPLHLTDRALDAQRVRQLVAGPELEHRLRLELAPGRTELDATAQVIVERDVAEGLGATRLGQRGLELLAVHPAFLATCGAHLVPIGVPQRDGDPLLARRDEVHRIAAAGAGVQLDVGVGHLHALHIGIGLRRSAVFGGTGGKRDRGCGDDQRESQAAARERGGKAGGKRARALHWVLQAPVAGSAGVNMLLPATLNSSWPCGEGWPIQYCSSLTFGSWSFSKIRPPPCSTPSTCGLVTSRLVLGEPGMTSPCAE